MEVLQLINSGSRQLKEKNIYTHKLDSEILLSKVLKKERENLLINLDLKVSPKKIDYFYKLINRRSFKEPIAHILGEKEFWSRLFLVNEKTLIPRPETELMVEKLVKIFHKRNIFILDIGTGSGCILLSILNELKNSRGIGIDVSHKAIKVAKFNSKKHKLDEKAKFFRQSLNDLYHRKFDLIVSNPPYIMSKDIKNLDDDVKRFEPKLALDGGNDGLDVIKKVIYKSKNILKIKGLHCYLILSQAELQISQIIMMVKEVEE